MKRLLIIALLLPSCTQEFLGLSRAQRFDIYGRVLTATGNSKIAAPVSDLGRSFEVIDKQPRNVSPSGK